MFGSIHRSLDL